MSEGGRLQVGVGPVGWVCRSSECFIGRARLFPARGAAPLRSAPLGAREFCPPRRLQVGVGPVGRVCVELVGWGAALPGTGSRAATIGRKEWKPGRI